MSKDAGCDMLFLRDLVVDAYIGATERERQIAQALHIELEAAIDSSGARSRDALEATVDYAALHARILTRVRASRFALLERLAQALLDEVLEHAQVLYATITLAKPGLLAGATASVVISGRRPARVALGLGANLADAPQTLLHAIDKLADVGRITACSALYRTQPWGLRSQPDFYNAAIILETRLMPAAVLAACKTIERQLGRAPGPRFGARVLDIDILDDFGEHGSALLLPHPRLYERAFALGPLAEIEPVFAGAFERLSAEERAGIERLAEWPPRVANKNF